MMEQKELEWFTISGTPFERGYIIGERGRKTVHSDVVKSSLWKEVTSRKHHKIVARLAHNTAQLFPHIFNEIEGIARGLALPFEQVFAWNCRGDLLSNTSDGCTTIQVPGKKIMIAHNEDGLPFFDKKCFIINVTHPQEFISFCYPGSIAGNTLAFTNKGMVVTINNLRLDNIIAEIPRMVLARAVLNCQNLNEVRNLLKNAPPTGGFHYSIAQCGDNRLLSLECGGDYYREKLIQTPSIHTNHMILDDNHQPQQIITQSSRERQIRGRYLLEQTDQTPLDILRDQASDYLPIWRQEPDDPDKENTIISAIFELNSHKLNWKLYSGTSRKILYDGKIDIDRG